MKFLEGDSKQFRTKGFTQAFSSFRRIDDYSAQDSIAKLFAYQLSVCYQLFRLIKSGEGEEIFSRQVS